jgi:hypothetical protein
LSVDPLGYVWIITSGQVNNLYKVGDFAALIMTIENTPTAVEVFGSFVYITTATSTDQGVLQRYNNGELETVFSFAEADSIINASVVFNNQLYLGAENGLVYAFDGLNMQTLSGTGNPVKLMVSDGNLLYLTEKNGSDVYVFNGANFISTT